MRNHHLFYVVAIVAAANLFTACDPEVVTVEKPVKHTIYVCADNSQVTDAVQCPPVAPVVETRTEYVCRGGTIVASVEQCPNWTVTCPPGTEPYMDEARHDDGCTYVATCHEGYAYDTTTSTCVKVACPPGQTINAGGDDCVPLEPEVVTETVTIYVCADGSEVSRAEDCPPTQPVVEIRTEYVCADGSTESSASDCPPPPNPRDCPIGQYLDANGVCINIEDGEGARGELYVFPYANMPASRIQLAGPQENHHVASFLFVASGESFRIAEIRLNNCLGFRTSDSYCMETGETAGSDRPIQTVTLGLEYYGGMAQTQPAILVGNEVVFSGLDYPVTPGMSATVVVFVETVSPFMINPVPSGERFQLNIAGFTAVGVSSGNVPENTVGMVAAANPMTYRVSKPIISISSDSPRGATAPGSRNSVLEFNITAAATGYVSINELVFRIMATNNSGGAPWVQRTPQSWLLIDRDTHVGIPYEGLWQETASGAMIFRARFLQEQEVSAGGTKRMILTADTSYANSSWHDILRVDIINVEWTDTGLGMPIDGDLVQNLPVFGGPLLF